MSQEHQVRTDVWCISASRGLVVWLRDQDVSLAVSTCQTGKLFLIGVDLDGRYAIYERTFERAMGLAGNDQTIFMATLFQIWRLENALQPGETLEGYDRHYVPQVGWTTGDLDVHDLALDAGGEIHLVSARFSCLATLSETHHFVPYWMPTFVAKFSAEDRSHLNGLAMVDGKPKYVTVCAGTDSVDGRREHRTSGGVCGGGVIDIQSDEVVASGLSMPHSPPVGIATGCGCWIRPTATSATSIGRPANSNRSPCAPALPAGW